MRIACTITYADTKAERINKLFCFCWPTVPEMVYQPNTTKSDALDPEIHIT